MRDIQTRSVDAIITDLPFGTTKAHWDRIIDLDKLWFHYRRIIKEDGAIVLFCQQPFTTKLIGSAMDIYRYSWIWRKNKATGFLNAAIRPLNNIEEIAVFGLKNPNYYPQMRKGALHKNGKQAGKRKKVAQVYGDFADNGLYKTDLYFPDRILEFANEQNPKHPTQKPQELLQYLIKTYTKEGELVLDSCCGSGSCLIAAKTLNRNFIGIELEREYFELATNELSTRFL